MPSLQSNWRAFLVGLIVCLTAGCQSNSVAPSTADNDGASDPPPDLAIMDSPAIPTLLTSDEVGEGWISLFDGESLFGWRANSEAKWRVEDRAIVVDGKDLGLLCTTAQYGNYVLKVDFRSDQGTNSGIFLRTAFKPTDPGSDCYELNIAPPDNPFPTCSLVKRAKAEGEHESREWQTFEVTMMNGNVNVGLNGRQVLDYTDLQPLRRGHIGLQLNQGKVEFKNIKLKPLDMTPLFNGKDLTGWKSYPDLPSKFTVTPEGAINVQNGRGQLETEKQYGDFVLQLDCISLARNLNSGVFFRCIPGEQMNGYECQIHNGYKNNDRTKPMDCGTGGIFRRKDARLVVSNDLEWFHMTLIADGNHMSSWVNGYPVCDWTDERKPDPNPRNGRRDEPGTIMLQGHDPTTNLSFRNLRIAEVPPRSQP